LQELGLPELTAEQVEQLCIIAEAAARKNVLSKISSKKIEKLDISAEAEGSKPLRLTVDVNIVLSPDVQGLSVREISEEAVKQAFVLAEKYLRELACHSLK
jgi:hypothetical protein